MKVLILTAHFRPNTGGVETHLDDLSRALVEDNNEVVVLTYRPLTTKTKWTVVERSTNLKIYRLPWIPGLFYKLVPFPVLSFLYLLPGLLLVEPIILIRYRPDVIHAHGLVAGFAGVFWGKLFGIRTVVSTHSLYEFPESGLYRTLVKWIFSRADHVSTLSKQALKEIRSLGIAQQKSSNFTYWVDQTKFKPIKNAKRKVSWNYNFTVLFVGRLVEEKGISVLLNSLSSWNKSIHLVIAGNGPLEDTVKEVAKKNKNLHYLGRIDQSELPIYYSAADVLVVPSIHEEGFGRVIVESLSCGTPVIGANRGAIPEAIDSSVGRLISVSPEIISTSVEKLYYSPKLLKSLSVNSRKYALTRYGVRNYKGIKVTYIPSKGV